MNLTPTEQERLTIFTSAQLAREHRKRGIALSHPEAVAYICDELLYMARQGKALKDVMGMGSQLLSTDDVLPGVAELIPVIHIEAMFLDGTKLVTVHQPVRPGEKPRPARVLAAPGTHAAGRWNVSFHQRESCFAEKGFVFGRGVDFEALKQRT